jgi:Asp-tRNA(Asn)/Glu-tRNA(Gln) amidotransferase A subunit family amidase
LVSGDIAAKQLIREACDRVDLIEPRLRALVAEPDRERRLLAEAERHDPSLQPFLVGIKDIVNVAGLPTKAGSTLPSELFAGPEASVVSRLRTAGAIVLGKTTTTEFAFSQPAPTTNPHNEHHTPGGSSSGSAAAVAAGYVPLAIGTQTVDSIVTPAAYCGVVGYKPSYGRIPIDGVLPFSQAMDHVGFLASDLTTIEFAAGIVCSDWRGTIEPELPAIGLPAPAYFESVEPAAIAIFDRTVAALSAAGCRVLQTDRLADIAEIGRRHRRLIASQFATVHREWYSDYGDRYRPKSEALFAEGAALGPDVVEEGLKGSTHLRTDLEQTMDELGIDIWISPATTGPAPRGLETIGDPIMAMPWTHAHLPVVCLPTGTTPSGLPLGIQLVGRLGADEELLDFARAVARSLG